MIKRIGLLTLLFNFVLSASQEVDPRVQIKPDQGLYYYSKSILPWKRGQLKQRQCDMNAHITQVILTGSHEDLKTVLTGNESHVHEEHLACAHDCDFPEKVQLLLEAQARQAYKNRINSLSPLIFSRPTSVSPLSYTSEDSSN